MDSEEQQFIQGFNNGYLLEQYEPTLLAKVLNNISTSTVYISGLSSGQQEYQQEYIRLEYENLSKLREKNKEDDRDIERW